ncbi:MAG: energy transducer TonB [Acidobacteriota bacterium]|jgi:TonB family protein
MIRLGQLWKRAKLRDHWVPSTAVVAAILIHAFILFFATRQYMAAAANPAGQNQAAQRLQTVNGQPVRFVYVKDMKPSKLPPMDQSRKSDMNRRGASPYKEKGNSPDPQNFGNNPVRQQGGKGNADVTRPFVRPSKGARPSRGSAGRAAAAPQPRRSPSQAKAKGKDNRRNGREEAKRVVPNQKGAGTVKGKPSNSRNGLPVGGAREQASKGRSGANPAPRRPASVGSQIQQMMLGSLQSGFNNPNASRLNTGNLSFDTAAWDLGPYARKVQQIVKSNWSVPAAQEVLQQEGWVAVHFYVNKDGSITDLRVIRSSNIPSYDQSALDALRTSNPLPPLPSFVTVPRLGAVFRFYYFIQSPDQ